MSRNLPGERPIAEGQRLTKRERRERARAESRAAEAAAAKAARRRRVRNAAIAIAVIAGIVVVVLATSEEPPRQVQVTAAEVEQAQQEAACTPADVPQLEAKHLDRSTAPPASQLYPLRPASSGPHFASPLAPVGFKDEPVDERSAVHNLEHGAVIVWYGPQRVDKQAIQDWVEARNRAGFVKGARAGGAVTASPYPEDVAPAAPVALRAWGRAVDCERFDPTAADGFLASSFGTRGEAPEGSIAGYPEGAIRIVE